MTTTGGFLKKMMLLTMGGVSGGLAGWFLGELIVYQVQKKEEEKYWGEKITEPIRNELEKLEKLADVDVEPVKKIKRNYTGKFKDDNKGELRDIVKPYNTIVPPPEKSSVEVSNIRIIGEDDYATRKQEYEKENAYFYDGDSVWLTEDGNVIENPNTLFGANIHLQFGSQSTDPDSVFLRNDALMCDYQLIRLHEHYSISVLGLEEEPKEKPKKRKTRKKQVKINDDIVELEEDDGE